MADVSAPHWDGTWLDPLPRAVFALTPEGTVVGCNQVAQGLLGAPADALVGRPFDEVALSGPDRGGFAEVLSLVRDSGAWAGPLRLTRADGTGQPVHAHLAAVRRDGVTVGATLSIDFGDNDQAGPHLSDRLTRLARVAAELQNADDIKRLTDVVVTHMADAAGATAASLSMLVDDETLALVGIRGGTPGAASQWATYPVDESTPAGSAVLARRPLVLTGRDEIEARYPDIELAAGGERSMLCLPLVIAGRPVGVATLSFPSRREIDDAELEFFVVMADSCAQTLARIRALETVEDQNAKLRFLAEASAELASSLDYERTLTKVVHMAVPDLADWCAVSLEQDGYLRTLAVAHRDPAKIALALRLQQDYPPDPDAPGGSYEVLRTGESLLLPEIPEELLVQSAQSPEHLDLIRQLELRSAVTAPLKARGRIFGVITWVNGEDGRRLGPDDVSFAEDLARRAAIAIDNALLHSELREIADRLQQAVLPPALPVLAGWDLAASYSSAGRVDVGGDFYDAIPLPDGRLALVIGDVMGRGVDAAAAMSQVRAALRAIIAVDPDPTTVMTRLDLLYERFPTEQLVSLIYAVADQSRGELELTSAGHPTPLMLHPDRPAEYLEGARGTILGVGLPERRVIRVDFDPGDTLLLFTDGLLERRGEDYEAGKDRLVQACSWLGPELTGAELDQLVAVMRDPTRDDDVAILAVRRSA